MGCIDSEAFRAAECTSRHRQRCSFQVHVLNQPRHHVQADLIESLITSLNLYSSIRTQKHIRNNLNI